ncbi:helix-turn-helix domain-containing protein [Dongia sp.]|uniref:helix-turn-helix domain-containing protein n=1 Tax=Dongia sp. TaxID=1977262 RepID=UPI0035B4AFA2
MSIDDLAAALAVLEKVALASPDAEVDTALDQMRTSLRGAEGDELFEGFQGHVNAIRRIISGHALTERGLNLLIETTHDLSSTLTVQDLLQTIVTRARSLVGANIAWVTIQDEESGLFRTVTAEGHLSPTTALMTSRVEYGAVSLILKSKSFFETQDYLHDQRFRHLPELDRVFETENIVSLTGLPILSEGKVLGFLFVADRYSRKLSGREISVLGSFALHAGVAMRNANLFIMLKEALGEAERNRSALIEHIQRVENSAAAHDEMTHLLASGAELDSFLKKMAGQVGGAVFLCDKQLAIREEFASAAYGGSLAADLKSGKIDPALLIKANSESRHTGRSVLLVSRSNEQCRAIALHGGTERSESLLICNQGELDAIEVRNLERSAVALSIAKLWNERRETEKLIASSTLLRHLVMVSPPDEATISAVRDRLNLRADSSVQLAQIVLSGLDRAAQTAQIRESAAGLNILVDLLDDTYLAVGTEALIDVFLHNLVRARRGWEAGGIKSDLFTDLSLTGIHFGRVSRALNVLRNMKPLDRFLGQGDVNMFAKLFEVGDARRIASYLDETLRAINAGSPRQREQLKQTLLCYFDSQHNIKLAAETLGVHVNTMRQRLDTLREVTGGWDDPIKALELHVALRLDAINT